MRYEIIFPKGNEKELVTHAISMGYNRIILVYDSLKLAREMLIYRSQKKQVKIDVAIVINSEKNDEVRMKALQASRLGILPLAVSKGGMFDRFVLEKTEVAGILRAETVQPKDHLHFRRSGIDQVSAKLAKEKNKFFAASLKDILETKAKSVKILGRIMQNNSFSKKYKFDYFIASFADDVSEIKGASDLKSLLACLK